MNVRWMAVLTGYIVDTLISLLLLALLSSVVTPEFSASPDLTQPADLVLLCLLLLSTGIGGYVAGRMAPTDGPLHGLLVGVVGILVNQLETLTSGSPLSHTLVIASGVGCLIGGLGGFLSRYPTRDRPPSAGRWK
jgi:putative membrane protein (TIGR04086 family)